MTGPEHDTAPPDWSEPELRRWIVGRLADAGGVAESEIDPTATFSALGVDSVAAVELVAELETVIGRALDPTLVFSAETPAQLAAVLASGATAPRPRRRPARAATGDEHHEPIAIVGIGCRFPGALGPEDYWQMLIDGTDAVGTVPDGRWRHDPSLPSTVDRGGFVTGIDQFDPGFFGITQLEADRMDPQQRMLLEVAWEAFEDAAIRPSSARGTDVGVFVGISGNEYSRRQSAAPELIDVFFGTGNALSIAANRISYALDLHGPSIAVDTACSSSLVAVHLACASLRRGECTSALAGGANAILTPLITLNFTGAGVIAPDGRCKTFDASADGIVRGEGAGLVLLKRLSDAVADGDRIYCVVDGSATNQDGRSNGLTAPDPDAQMDVFSTACSDAGVDPRDVDYVEAHGTGTVLGDAMELRSLDAVYGGDRPDGHPLRVGSVKTNIGHLESAAGVAGLVKTALSLQHARIPPTLHYREPNPYLSETSRIAVVDEVTSWDQRPTRRAAVSGFGFGGTNAHVVLSSAPGRDAGPPDAASTTDPTGATPIVLPLSARSPASLASSVAAHAARLAESPDDAAELAASQALTRDEHPRRLAVVAPDGATVAAALADVAAGKRHPCAIAGERRSTEPARVAFLFSGQGRAWWPLDAELLADPVIASVLRTCDTELRELAEFSLLELIRSGEPVLDHERAQPLLFALQVALAARWRAFGVAPDLIVGQSIGEIAAAHVAGALPLADALEIVLHRGRLMEESNGTGHTAFVELPATEVAAMISDLGVDVAIAAVTAPDNCVVSGPKHDTVAVVEAAVAAGAMAQVFDVGDIPGHGPLMAPYAEKLSAAVDFLDPRGTTVPMISSVTAAPIAGEALDAAYWGANLRQQVRLLEAVEVAVDHGAELFIEIAPHPVVSFSTRRTLESIGSDA
ncbi:MAG: acyltransferase domain-containing protein, partial [Actinobacteria bacterium]|nr:acyltransferase domain-containing protein [Actinomycetota bacterium]